MGSGARGDAGKPVGMLLGVQWLDSRDSVVDKLTGFPEAPDGGCQREGGDQVTPKLVSYRSNFQSAPG